MHGQPPVDPIRRTMAGPSLGGGRPYPNDTRHVHHFEIKIEKATKNRATGPDGSPLLIGSATDVAPIGEARGVHPFLAHLHRGWQVALNDIPIAARYG